MTVNDLYYMFSHVSIMIFTGFGFLMTFLKRFGYSAVGLNLLLSCLAFLWNILVGVTVGTTSRAVAFQLTPHHS